MFLKILIGAIGGIVAGMGMGGGTLTIPLLSLFLAFNQIEAQGINLISFLPMSVVALIIHAKNKLVKFKQTWGLALIGCIFSLIGALIANKISNSVMRKMFAVFLIGLAVYQIVGLIKKQKTKTDEKN